jgi:hypothetical protein
LRAVTTATAAAALGLDRKAFDNIIARLSPDLVPKGRQGRERRISIDLLTRIFLAAELSGRTGMPIREAFILASKVADRGIEGLGPHLTLTADLAGAGSELQHRLSIAIESVVRRRRGRPRGK